MKTDKADKGKSERGMRSAVFNFELWIMNYEWRGRTRQDGASYLA